MKNKTLSEKIWHSAFMGKIDGEGDDVISLNDVKTHIQNAERRLQIGMDNLMEIYEMKGMAHIADLIQVTFKEEFGDKLRE